MPRTRRASFVMLSIASLGLGSCYSFATPSYHPGEARDLVTAIARQGLTIHSTIPGDSACDDPGLIANATRFAITDPADDMDRDVWLYTFRERYWDASRTAVDACQAVFEAANPGSTVTRIDIPLYRAFGADWSAGLTTSLEAALADAADAGRP